MGPGLKILTREIDLETAELKLDALQRLAHGLVVVVDRRLASDTEGQREVGVRLLPVVVRPDRVHPQDDLVLLFVLENRHKRYRTTGIVGGAHERMYTTMCTYYVIMFVRRGPQDQTRKHQKRHCVHACSLERRRV